MSARREVLSPLGTPNVSRRPSSPSTFISPSTSKHTGLSSPVPMLTTEHEDEKEKRERRRSRVLELQRRNVGSPSSPADRRRSLPLSGLSTAQLTDHYTNCIKLSAENKINAKNAFGLHLIDYMSDLLKKKELENFQVASTTLDASAKIYAGRVDAIHAETYKVLTGLGRGADKTKQTEDEAGEEVDGAVPGEEDINEPKKKRKTRKSNTVETNLKNINVNKFDLGFEVDPLFQVMSAAFDEGGTSGLLVNNLSCYDDQQQLVLDSSTIVSAVDSLDIVEKSRKPVDLSDIKEMFHGIDVGSMHICPSFASFQFTNWDGGDVSSILPGASDHAFDVNAEPEPIPNTNDDVGDNDLPMDGEFPDMESIDGDTSTDNCDNLTTEQSVFIGDGRAAQLVESALKDITHSTMGTLLQVLASEPSDYSYFNKALLRTWAGPSHWRIGPLSKDPRFKLVDKSQKNKTKKLAFTLDYEDEVDFDQYFKDSKATTLTKATLSRYTKEQTTLPKDLHYDADKLFRLFMKPKIMIKRQNTTTGDIDADIDNYDYENINDRENYCPKGDEDDDDDYNGGEMNFTDGSHEFSHMSSQDVTSQQSMLTNDTFNGTLLSGDRLLAQPYKIAQIDISYAKTAKKIDVKRVKSQMWRVLTDGAQNKDTENNACDIPPQDQQMTSTLNFQELLTILPTKVSTQTARNLSVPIAFVCLLHLANEKTLKIIDQDMEDLQISQGI